jgi:hypothetical protein
VQGEPSASALSGKNFVNVQDRYEDYIGQQGSLGHIGNWVLRDNSLNQQHVYIVNKESCGEGCVGSWKWNHDEVPYGLSCPMEVPTGTKVRVRKGWASIIWNVDESYRSYSHNNPDPAFQDSSLNSTNCMGDLTNACVGWRAPCLRALPYQPDG